jgi:selenide,water dikinase
MRFIDLAAHGGCSKKGPAKQLRELLNAVQSAHASSHLEEISANFPDTGVYKANGLTLLSSVDVVLPMTLSPADFGKITVCHVLSDIYAGGALPLFALCILGIPGGMSAASRESVQVMTAASEQLSAEGTVLVGGHTMTDQEDFYLGFCAVGKPIGAAPFVQVNAQPGDRLILTKPLGTSIATARWKLEQSSEMDHADVLRGMLLSNRKAAIFLAGYELSACTDVTGYGFLGHLYNILFASKVASVINLSMLPCYESILKVTHPSESRQMWHNKEYVKGELTLQATVDPLMDSLLFDSQVSGGLLICVKPKDVEEILTGLRHLGFPSACVGEIRPGTPGAITIAH